MKIIHKLGYFTAFTLPALVVFGYYLDGYWNFITLIYIFLVLPIIDQVVGISTYNVPESKSASTANDFYYRFITYLWTYFQLAFMAWGFYVVVFGHLNTVLEWCVFVLNFSLVTGGIGITVAHELGHKKSAVERFYSKVLLMTVSYMHFYIEHNRGHHVLVATPEDPATAYKNESFFAFWVKSVFKGYAHAWKLENDRMKKKDLPVFSVKNQMVSFTLLPFLFCALVMLIFYWLTGTLVWQIPLFFFAQSILAFTLLELVNYVEHYGIMRKEVSPGRYERVTPVHSWNSSHIVSNFFLFQLQRHSDHHANAIKRYQVLDHYEESPQLPAGYNTMILIALVPPLWYAIMNKRLEKWQGAA